MISFWISVVPVNEKRVALTAAAKGRRSSRTSACRCFPGCGLKRRCSGITSLRGWTGSGSRPAADDDDVALPSVVWSLSAKRASLATCRAAALPGHGGEPGQQPGSGPRLEHRRLGVGTDIASYLEPAERAAALGVRLPLGDPFPVEIATCSIR